EVAAIAEDADRGLAFPDPVGHRRVVPQRLAKEYDEALARRRRGHADAVAGPCRCRKGGRRQRQQQRPPRRSTPHDAWAGAAPALSATDGWRLSLAEMASNWAFCVGVMLGRL